MRSIVSSEKVRGVFFAMTDTACVSARIGGQVCCPVAMVNKKASYSTRVEDPTATGQAEDRERTQKRAAGKTRIVAPSVDPQAVNLLARVCAVVGCQDLRLAGIRS